MCLYLALFLQKSMSWSCCETPKILVTRRSFGHLCPHKDPKGIIKEDVYLSLSALSSYLRSSQVALSSSTLQAGPTMSHTNKNKIKNLEIPSPVSFRKGSQLDERSPALLWEARQGTGEVSDARERGMHTQVRVCLQNCSLTLTSRHTVTSKSSSTSILGPHCSTWQRARQC